MRGRVYRGTPEAMALYQPSVAPKPLQILGVPLGNYTYMADLMFFHPHLIDSKTTSVTITGEQGAGKSTFAKSMVRRCSLLQARDPLGNPEYWRTHIMSRRSENGIAEYGPMAESLHATFFKIGKGRRINLIGLLKSPTSIISATVGMIQDIGKQYDNIQIAPTVLIAVTRILNEKPELVGERLIAEALRGLVMKDFDEYYKEGRRQLEKDFEQEFKRTPKLREQLRLDATITHVDLSFLETASHAAKCLDRLMGPEYGDAFGGKESLYEILIQRVALLDTEDIPGLANAFLEAVIMQAQNDGVQYNVNDIGTNLDLSRTIPHLYISDEEGTAAKGLFHLRTQANGQATVRKRATSHWRMYQFGMQITEAGSAGSEMRALGKEIDLGVGIRFFMRQSDDSDVLHEIAKLPGMTEELVAQMPYFEPGEGVLWIRNREPVRFQHRLLESEIPLVQSDASRDRLRNIQPIDEMPGYYERLAKLEAHRAKQLTRDTRP